MAVGSLSAILTILMTTPTLSRGKPMNRNIAVICAAIIIKTIERCLTAEHKGIYHLNEARLGGETHGRLQSCGGVCGVCLCVSHF